MDHLKIENQKEGSKITKQQQKKIKSNKQTNTEIAQSIYSSTA